MTRNHWADVGALAIVVSICWVWLVPMAHDMYGPMSGPAAWMMTARWDWAHLLLLFAMWDAMMVGMMLPSAVPTLLEYARRVRAEADASRPLRRIAAFAGGYLCVWTCFSLVATVVQRAISQAMLLTPMMEPSTPAFAAILLLVAGAYQFLPAKRACLLACRSLPQSSRSQPRSGTALRDAFRLGIRHGVSCLMCCWVLMLLLFAGGVMNLAVIAAVMAIVLVEKAAPFGSRSTAITGGVLIALGVWIIVR